MACNSSCYLNCDQIISDQCVQYTGPDIPALGICTNDQLSSIEAVILNELQGALEGTGIEPENVTLENCQWLASQFAGQDPNLSNLLQLLIDSECSLKAMIDAINVQLAAKSMNFNTLCLQGLPANPTTNDILQATVNLLCSINTTVSQIPTTYVKLSDLNNLVQQIITQFNQQSSTSTLQYFNYIPLKVALPYFGDLSAFDNTGKGLSSAGMTNIYICNGQNGTPDLRGRTIVGAIRNVPGGSLDPAVDPNSSANTAGNVNYSLNDKFGENFHQLSSLELPSHSHAVSDPGHTHTINTDGIAKSGTDTSPVWVVDQGVDNNKGTTSFNNKIVSAKTNVTVASTGGNQPHNNVQPSAAAYWIIRMV